jgi:hypothetical protein
MCLRNEDIKFWSWRVETVIFTNGRKFRFIRITQTNSFSQKEKNKEEGGYIYNEGGT